MITATESRAFLALGGNLGEPLQAFKTAIRKLAQHPQINLKSASALYRTPPIGGPSGQPDYLNAVVELVTNLDPQGLLDFCQQIENAAGRTRTIRWEARSLDIDLLFYDQLNFDIPTLSLPHPRLHERHFVLMPLAEVAASYRHPVLQKTVAELLTALPAPQGITRLEGRWLDND